MKIILTRQNDDCLQTINLLKTKTKNFIVAPLIEVKHNIGSDKQIDCKTIALLTSKNSIPKLISSSKDKLNQRIITVGKRTAEEIKKAGFKKIILVSEDIRSMIKKIKLNIQKGEKIVYFKSNYTTLNIKESLENSYIIEYIEAYDVYYRNSLPKEIILALKDGKTNLFCFFSPKICEVFVNLVMKSNLLEEAQKSICIVISKASKEKISLIKWKKIIISKYKTNKSMAKSIDYIISKL